MMKIVELIELSEDSKKMIKNIIQNNFIHRFFPYFYGLGVTPEKYSIWITNDIQRMLLDNTKNTLMIALEDSNIIGMIAISLLDHDSKIFNMKMGKLHCAFADLDNRCLEYNILSKLVECALKTCSRLYIDHVSTKVNTLQIPLLHAMHQNGFKTMSTHVRYRFNLRKSIIPKLKYSCLLRKVKTDEDILIGKLAKSCFQNHFDRFHSDPHLKSEKSDLLYYTWAFNSCHGFADKVIVAEYGGQLAGFITLKYNQSLSDLLGLKIVETMLSAVDNKFRKHKIFTSMTHYSLKLYSSNSGLSCHIMELGTQINNYPVQQAWSNLGFKVVDSNYNLHKMLD